MLDLKAIRRSPEEFKTNLARKGVKPDAIDEILVLDTQKRALQTETEALKAKQNTASKAIPTLSGEEKMNMLAEMKKLSALRKQKAERLEEMTQNLQKKLENLPNPPHATAPDGKDDSENVEIKTWGEKPVFDFTPKDHAEIAEGLGILDMQRGAKVAGSRFYYLKNELALLQRGLMQWAFQFMANKGYTPTIPPYVTRKNAIYGTGYLEKDENYVINPNEDDLYLIGTSEVPMVSLHADEILDVSTPKKYCAFSPCFRREAGSYGKDTKGIFRVHQFEKVEMVVFCHPNDTEAIHMEILQLEEELMQALELPYRVVNVCTGDLGGSAAKKYDIEAWLPGQNAYREMTSTSICTDFQARRLNIRFKGENKTEFVHILNGTAVSSRPLVAIIENFQTADGGFTIPDVLVPFVGKKEIKPV